MLFKLSNMNSNLALTLGYLNPAWNNSALVIIKFIIVHILLMLTCSHVLVVRCSLSFFLSSECATFKILEKYFRKTMDGFLFLNTCL